VVSFPQDYPPNPCMHLSSLHTCYTFRPFHYTWFRQQSTDREAPHFAVFYLLTSTVFGPNIFLSTLLSNIISLRSSLNATDQISYPYQTTGKIRVPCILNFIFLYRNLKTKIYYLDQQMHNILTIKYYEIFRCIYIIFRESLLIQLKLQNKINKIKTF